ncbi:MarR family winged helix-turn-helix transcriptional regulator [Microbacterium sp. SD291]|uniref:MarR family winged helix-turn-helix transcriptional regulator n=1 Tax=Microbacterium sp. SD291 TaxID=2782007 RepID=UPI001A95EDE8|nr:hypothetical protein [Microbacterium sp. SD291]MBO0980246.1 hypothetical protein [Microbacterium sp. SD291]
MNSNDTQNTSRPSRPFGYWLKAVDRLMAAEFATAFENEGASRRDWRLLNIVDGTVPARRPLHPRKLEGLIARGWVARDGDGWTLTDEGRAAKDRLGAIVSGIRAKVTDAVPAEDLATTIASLEQIARAFGWDEETPLPRGRGRRHGFGRGFGRGVLGHGFGRRPGHHGHPFGRGFGPGFAHGEDHGFGPDADHGCEHGHGRRFGHGFASESGHGHRARQGHQGHHGHQHAYERGFDAGYSRGRDA